MDKLVMVGLHTQPTSAVAEIDALVDVVAWAEKVSHNFWLTHCLLLGGSF